ncbi:MAG: acetyl-CoA acetyltransferase [Acidobacteria bacterium]|nr:acetyl-CoA acetyltransferase [Acidobacteriota bacterium]
MRGQVAIIGIGIEGLSPRSQEHSYREMIHAAAVRAYTDAGIEPDDIDSAVTVAEDLFEGVSIFDEYTPDQLGAVLKPIHTIAGDSLQGLGAAALQIATGAFDIIVLEAHSKASNISDIGELETYALDPTWNRQLGYPAAALAGMEMASFLHDSGNTPEHCAQVVVNNRANALANPSSTHGGETSIDAVLGSELEFAPLRAAQIAPAADGAIVLVLASHEAAIAGGRRPVWIEGLSWSTDHPAIEDRDLGRAAYCEQAAARAYAMAGIEDPMAAFDFAEVDDRYAYKHLQHLEALGLCGTGEAGPKTLQGHFSIGGALPVNPSGGSLGAGHLYDAAGLYKIAESAHQLRGDAGALQIADANCCLVQSWRGVPTATGGVAVLSNHHE